MPQAGTLILIMSIAVLAPLLAHGVARRLPVPLVIFEIALGILVGPAMVSVLVLPPLALKLRGGRAARTDPLREREPESW